MFTFCPLLGTFIYLFFNIFLSRKCILTDCIFVDNQRELDRLFLDGLIATPPLGGRRGRSFHSTSTENVWNSVSALGSGRWFFSPLLLLNLLCNFFFFNITSTSTLDACWANCPGLHRKRWLLRLRSPPPHRSLRHRNLRPPEKKMTPSWENLVELWQEGKKPRKVNSEQNN